MGEWNLALSPWQVSGGFRARRCPSSFPAYPIMAGETHGAQVITRFAPASTSDLDAAIEDLRQRERTPNRNRIGSSSLCGGGTASVRKRSIGRRGGIRKWAQDQGVEGVVWTALGPHFVNCALDAATIYAER